MVNANSFIKKRSKNVGVKVKRVPHAGRFLRYNLCEFSLERHMKTLFPIQPSFRSWKGKFGLSRDEVVQRILDGNFFEPGHPRPEGAEIRVNERYWNLSACILSVWKSSTDLLINITLIPAGIFPILTLFSITGEMLGIYRLSQCGFFRLQYQFCFIPSVCWRIPGLACRCGTKFLATVLRLAVEIGAEHIITEPGQEGSWYWTSRGALIQEWPKDICDHDHQTVFSERVTALIENRESMMSDWPKAMSMNLIGLFVSVTVLG